MYNSAKQQTHYKQGELLKKIKEYNQQQSREYTELPQNQI